MPINGTKYSAGSTTTSASITVALLFQIATSGWQVSQNVKGVVTVLASGSVPSGAVSVQYTDTWLNASGDTGAGTNTNGASSYTAITGSYVANSDSLSVAGGGGTKQTTHSVLIQMENSSGVVISTTTITFEVTVDGE